MNTRKSLFAALLGAALILPLAAAADEEMNRTDKAGTHPVPVSLSEQEVQQLLAGRGMGAGRPAMVHGYPGPMHVLRQAEALDLDNNQIARTGALRQRVQSVSRDLGARIVEAEHELDRILGRAPVDREQMRAQLNQIANLRAELRAAHLETHLDQAELLTESQRERMEPHSPRGGQHQHRGEGRQRGEGGKMVQGGQHPTMQGGKQECNCNCQGSGKRQNRNSESHH